MKEYLQTWTENPFIAKVISQGIWILIIVLATLITNRVTRTAIKKFAKRYPQAGNMIAVIKTIVSVSIWVIAVLMILQAIGIAITPILAAFGVGGLAIALSVQDSLSNLFAGLHVLISHQIKVGDVVEIEPDYKGTVVDITWRFTVLEVNDEQQIIIPNSKIAQTIIKRTRPHKTR